MATIELVQEGDFEEVVVWGSAGKGAVLSFTLSTQSSKEVTAVDVDPQKQNLFMEGSGVQIFAPSSIGTKKPAQTLVIVANPLHFREVSNFLGPRNVVTHLGLLARTAKTGYL
jgi:hypothetical protein